MARRHKYSYSGNYYPRYANDNYRPRPRLVYSSPLKPRIAVRGFRFPKVALLGLLSAAERRRRYFDDLVRSQEDRRRFDPRRSLAPPGALSRAARVLRVASPSQYSTDPGRVPVGITFAAPEKVAICVRRRVRKEVLFAKGRGGGGNRPPRRNYWSDVQC